MNEDLEKKKEEEFQIKIINSRFGTLKVQEMGRQGLPRIGGGLIIMGMFEVYQHHLRNKNNNRGMKSIKDRERYRKR